ncbi:MULTISPECIES: iron ABC transporter permease [unclassified Sporosarcina]|uniref:FecCD family ABC transporter permease n=1 Tax=unclassified Sporosarcina TaxID=2647733 RepID=UPI002040C5E4|nr:MULTISPECIES: iron ABC transporter permease [unclassified Sporosarcina]GKV64002.1 iron ABC transporter permease [Sporosarcina sp. NCCP-2331]GLB54783.1 iron ABC transporter permease [Sporosarcina sp. NCCP-2378]
MILPRIRKKQRLLVGCLVVLILLLSAVAMGLGYASIEWNRIIPVFLGQGTFKEEFVLFSIRLPRILITLLAGAALALSGAILQGITRNDLADPGIIGINSGAGVAIALFFLFIPIEAGLFSLLLPLAGFAGALVTSILIYLFAYSRKTGLQPMRLVLVGIGFSMALSGIMVVIISSAEREKVDFISRWIAGNIWGTDWPFIWALLPWLLVLIPFALYKAHRLDLLGLNESLATGVGVSVERERLVLLLTAVALAASAVSVTGGIAFVGLMAPHIAKSLIGPRHRMNLPIAILIGSFLLLLADTIGRNILEPDGIPAGIIVSLIGAPYFCYLLLKK